jgi:hypothetical protein
VATRWPDFSNAIAMCMATVDLPDPPFSLATTITRVADIGASMNRCEGLMALLALILQFLASRTIA